MSKQNMPFFLAILSLVIISWNCFINLYFTRQNIRCLKLANKIENSYANLQDNIKRKTAAKYELQQDIDDTKTIRMASQLAERAAMFERFEELKEENKHLEMRKKEELEKKAEGQIRYGNKLKQFAIKLLNDKETLLHEISTVNEQLKKLQDIAG